MEYKYEVVKSQNVLVKCTQVCALVHLIDDVLEYEKVYSADVLRYKRGSAIVNDKRKLIQGNNQIDRRKSWVTKSVESDITLV